MSKMKYLVTSLLIVFSCWAQPDVNINDPDWTSSSSNGPCGCSTNFNNGSIQNFHDTGGSASAYSANENESITFCPDATGSKVVAVFATNAGYLFDVDPSDTIYVYDGPTNASPLLEKLNNSITPNGFNELSENLITSFFRSASRSEAVPTIVYAIRCGR